MLYLLLERSYHLKYKDKICLHCYKTGGCRWCDFLLVLTVSCKESVQPPLFCIKWPQIQNPAVRAVRNKNKAGRQTEAKLIYTIDFHLSENYVFIEAKFIMASVWHQQKSIEKQLMWFSDAGKRFFSIDPIINFEIKSLKK